MYQRHLGNTIRQLRLNKEMTQKELADILHLSNGTVSNYENDVHAPDLDSLCAMARCFNVSTDYLLNQTGNPDRMDEYRKKCFHQYSYFDVLWIVKRFSPGNLCRLFDYMNLLQIYQEHPENKKR